ncbi:ribosomal protein S5 domain 2-type protein [Dunaliella salina]|uniref:polyribonucleotide nucleotidyltransferase n=1 Tax=Dunaliella salina TaxID=3046 RepID=A0ABZ3KDR4_DUNSA|nr:ribosomal protein S5 domain 2-type protein [Dunaliella salina]|eukprot:KAF5827312.1 ribosomal protein S5 domain 2-type protein [Dunaliella salina]
MTAIFLKEWRNERVQVIIWIGLSHKMRRLARSISSISRSRLLQKEGIEALTYTSTSDCNACLDKAPCQLPHRLLQACYINKPDKAPRPKARHFSASSKGSQLESRTVVVGGRELSFETSEVARLADGSCVLRQGGTTVLATAVGGNDMLEGEDPATLQVSFREPFYGTGMLPRSMNKRERGSGTERETLVSRAIDRSLRPLLLPGYHYPVDVHARVLSQDADSMDPDTVAINAASTACVLSNIPWNGPIGAVRVAHIDDAFVVSPGPSMLQRADMDILVAGTSRHVLMLEMNGAQVSESTVAEAMHLAQSYLGPLIEAQLDLAQQYGRQKREAPLFEVPATALEQLTGVLEPLLLPVLKDGRHMGKAQRGTALEVAKAQGWERAQALALVTPAAGMQQPSMQQQPDQQHQQQQQQQQQTQQDTGLTYFQYVAAFNTVLSRAMRAMILDEGVRPDGRSQDQMRPVSAKAAFLLPGVVHGSALFSRGETQALCVATVGNATDHAIVDGPCGPQPLPFMLHYSFPPFCTNEVDQLREPSRRELGHGALAKRALQPVVPTLEADDWPFSLRVNSETLASNGSSSMAAVCGGTMALLMAGVPLRRPVAGISIGLVSDGPPDAWDESTKRFALLTDIAGAEDSLGDMDFKIAGSEDGLTAMQLDMKLPGIPVEVLVSAMFQARAARLQLLEIMDAEVAAHQQGDDAAVGPCVEEMKIDEDAVWLLLGPGGSAVAALEQASGAKLVVQEDGRVQIYAPSRAKMAAACAAVRAVEGSDLVEGQIYPAKVSQLFDWGAVITLPNNAKHVLHISEMAHGKVRGVHSLLQVGEEIQVKCLGRDIRGMVRLSRKACLPREEAQESQAERT